MNKTLIMYKQIRKIPIMRNSPPRARSNVSMTRYHLTCLTGGNGQDLAQLFIIVTQKEYRFLLINA